MNSNQKKKVITVLESAVFSVGFFIMSMLWAFKTDPVPRENLLLSFPFLALSIVWAWKLAISVNDAVYGWHEEG